MQWYYADGSKQIGPFDDAAFEQLVQNGTIKPDTLVWRAGMTNWQPWNVARPGATSVPPAEPVHQPPIAGGPSINLQAFAEEARNRDYSVDIGGSLSQGWELLKSNFWLIVGGTFLVYLVLFASGAIPYVGPFLQLVLQGPLMGGLFVMFLKELRGEGGTLSDAFSGFGPRFPQLMLSHVVTSVLIGLCFVPCVAVAFQPAAKILAHATPDEIQRAFEQLGPMLLPALVLLMLGAVVATYLGTCWVFALPLVADKGLNFWSAMCLSMRVVNRHWLSVFALLVVGGFVTVLGLLGCCVGVFVTLPLFLGMMLYTYESIFSPPA